MSGPPQRAASAPAVGVLGVVIPARNERDRLPGCLAAVSASVASLRSQPGAPRVPVIVVDDASVDGTGDIAECWPGVEVVRIGAGRVGTARRAGVRQLFHRHAAHGTDLRRLWIACTDADSAVPEDWLATHLRHAHAGVELLLGTVRPDPGDLADGLLAAWRLRHLLSDGHPHVHGANLGIRGDTYCAAGGFADVPAHEDVLLADGVRAVGGRVMSTGDSPVRTSGRSHGRAPAGMAHYLRDLGDCAEPLRLEA